MLVFSIVAPFDLCKAQNQRVAYKLASQEYLGCARDQPMLGPFPVNPFFKGKALGTRLGGTDTSFGQSIIFFFG